MAVRPLLVASMLLVAGGAHAQALRCEAADGKVTYANTHCPPGTQLKRELAAPPPVNEADRKRAEERARADAARLREIESRERKEAEKLHKSRAAAEKQSAERERECRKLQLRLKQAEDDLSAASLAKRPAAEKARQRAREQYELSCRS